MTARGGLVYTQRRRLRARLGRLNPVQLLPPETRTHLRNAGREELLALRGLLDAAIRRMERQERNH